MFPGHFHECFRRISGLFHECFLSVSGCFCSLPRAFPWFLSIFWLIRESFLGIFGLWLLCLQRVSWFFWSFSLCFLCVFLHTIWQFLAPHVMKLMNVTKGVSTPRKCQTYMPDDEKCVSDPQEITEVFQKNPIEKIRFQR